MVGSGSKLSLDKPARYEIKVPGRFDESWSDWVEGMMISVAGGDDAPTVTSLCGVLADQAALHGVLNALYSLGLPLLSVRCIDPDPVQNATGTGEEWNARSGEHGRSNDG